MRFLFNWLMVFTMLLPTSLALGQASTNSSEIFLRGYVPKNYVKNPIGIANTNYITTSSAAVALDPANKLDNVSSFTCNTSSDTGYCEWTTHTIREPDTTGNCEVSTYYKGDGTLYSLQFWDGTSEVSQPLGNVTGWTRVAVNIPCASTMTARIRQTTAGTSPAINVGKFHVGRATNVGSADLTTATQSCTATGTWVSNTTYTCKYRQNGGWKEYDITATVSGGAPTATPLSFTLPTGDVIDSSKLDGRSGTPLNGFPILDGTSSMLNDGIATFSGGVMYATTTTVKPQAFNAAGTYSSDTGVTESVPFTFGASDAVNVKFRVPIVGLAASNVVMPDAQGWFAAGEISGANPSLGVASVTSYTEITNASLTLTPQSGSAAMGVMCSSTNSAATPSTSATTCSAGSESVGFNANFPRSGMYEICAEFAHQAEVDSGEGLRATFQVVQTATNAQTPLQETGSKVTSGVTGMTIASGVSSTVNNPHTRCGFFNLSSGTNGFRLMYEQIVGGTPNTSTLLADASTSEGQRAIRWSAKPVSQQQQAVLANSVSSANNNGTYYNSAQVGSTGTVTKETGDWISGSCVVASAVATCTLVAGAFSTDPACHATIFGETTSYNAVVTSASTSTVVVRTFDTANAAAGAAFALTCSSPR